MDYNGSRTLLLVEDEECLRSLLKDFLSGNGFEVETAACGEDALRWLASNSAQLIVSDINMPHGNGIELLKQLRNNGDPVPFFFITGGNSVSEKSALEMGASALFLKPNHMSELLDAVISHFSPHLRHTNKKTG